MTRLKGIALSGGAGTRLYRWPGGQQAAAAGLQHAVVYYPLTTPILAGCRDDAVENILAPGKAPKTATVSPLRRRGLGYRTIQRGPRRSVQTQS